MKTDLPTEERVNALREYEILDTAPEESFDSLARLASYICETPIAAVTFLDRDRQWFKSKIGISVPETSIEDAFCAHAIQKPRLFLVPDATLDRRFVRNRLVTGEPHIRFYAGAPLYTPAGVPVGSLCAMDRQPRDLSLSQREALISLGNQAVNVLELKKLLAQRTKMLEQARVAANRLKPPLSPLPICCYCKKIEDDDKQWDDVDHYLASHSQWKISPSVCPSCFEWVIGELKR